MKNEILHNAPVKQHLVNLNLIELGFNGEIQPTEIQPCIDALSFEEYSTEQNGQKFELIGVFSKEKSFIAAYLFMGDQSIYRNEMQYNSDKTKMGA